MPAAAYGRAGAAALPSLIREVGYGVALGVVGGGIWMMTVTRPQRATIKAYYENQEQPKKE